MRQILASQKFAELCNAVSSPAHALSTWPAGLWSAYKRFQELPASCKTPPQALRSVTVHTVVLLCMSASQDSYQLAQATGELAANELQGHIDAKD